MPGLLLAGIVLVMLSGWTLIFVRQQSGAYLPQSIIAQFDDTNNNHIGYLSGKYDLRSRPLRYVKGGATITRCSSSRSWTVSVGDQDPCRSYLAISPETTELDVTKASWLDWYTFSGGRLAPLQSTYLKRVCSRVDDCGGAGRGLCVNNACICESNLFGLRCEFDMKLICPVLQIDDRTSQFRSTRTLSASYFVLRNRDGGIVKVNDHPAFVSGPKAPHFDILLFSGLRWVITRAEDLLGFTEKTSSDLARYFESQPFDAFLSLTNVDQFSAKPDLKTRREMSSPVNLPWAPDQDSFTGFQDTRLLCTSCNEGGDNPCLHGGDCSSDGYCNCAHGTTGDLCQNIPSGNGRCDPFFNSALYHYDGGDCCSSTCRSSNVFKCGTLAGQLGDSTAFAGFPICEDPDALGCQNEEVCWSERTNTVSLLSYARNTFLSLTPNGMTLVISEPSLDAIRVFDQVDGQWIARGEALQSEYHIDLGRRIALSSLPGYVISRRQGRNPVVLAASLMSTEGPAVRVWQWGAQASSWKQVCDDIRFSCANSSNCHVRSLSLGLKGNRGVLSVSMNDGIISVLELFMDTFSCELKWTSTGSLARVSANGEKLAVAALTETTNKTIASAEFAIFDISTSIGTISPLDLNSEANFIPRSYPGPEVNSYFSQEPAFALSQDGTFFHVTGIGSDSLISIDTLQLDKDASQFELSGSVSLDFPAANLSCYELESGLSRVIFSADSASIAVQSADSSIHVLRYVQNGRNGSWHSSPAAFVPSTSEIDIAISGDGGILASADDVSVDVVGISQSCHDDETEIRISILLDENPQAISWFLDIIQIDDSRLAVVNNTIAGCLGCYDQGLVGGVVLERLCVPDNIVNCVRLSHQTDVSMSSGTEIAAFVSGSEFTSHHGSRAESESFVAENKEVLRANCAMTTRITEGSVICQGENRAILDVLITLDAYPEEKSWTLTSVDTGREFANGMSYDAMQAFTTVGSEVCVPSNSECLLFTILHTKGDGLCCSYGFGDFTLHLNDTEIYSPKIRFDSETQSVVFGTGCPPAVAPSTLAPPSQSVPNDSVPFIPTNHIFPTITVSAPSIDREPSTEQSAPSNLVSIPTSPPTATRTELQILITIRLDDKPEETGWSLSRDSDDVMVAQAQAGTYRLNPNDTIQMFVNITIDENYLFCISDVGKNGISGGIYSISFQGWPLTLGNGDFGAESCHVVSVSMQELEDYTKGNN